MKDGIKRIPCPHCREMILPEATKCRFCKEKIAKTRKHNYSLKSAYWTWLAAVLIFFLLLFYVGKSPSEPTKTWWTLWLGDFLFGVWAFIRLLRVLFRREESKRYKIAAFATFLGLVILMMNYHKVELALGYVPLDKPEPSSVPSPVVTPRASFSPKPTQAPRQGTTKKSPTPTQQPEQAQTTPTTVSCQLTFGTYYLTPEECNRYTSQGYGKGSSSYSYPAYTPTSQTSPTTTPQPQNNEAELAQRQHQECLQNAETTYRSQLRDCDTLSYYGDPRIKDGCISQANQKYASDKGSCN